MVLNTAAYLLLCGYTVALLVFINSSQAVVLTEVLKQVKDAKLISINLALADELTCVFVAPWWGSISDRWGHHKVASIGLLLMAVAIWRYPMADTVYPGLVATRIVFALGASACVSMMTALLAILRKNVITKAPIELRENAEAEGDVGESESDPDGNGPDIKFSSRMSGIAGFCSGLGAVAAVTLLLPLPAWLGLDKAPVQAVQMAFKLVAILTVIVAAAMWRLLPRSQEPLLPLTASESYASHVRNVLVGFSIMKQNSALLFAYLGSFIARALSVVVALWIPLLVIYEYHKVGKCGTGDDDHGCRAGVIDAAIATGIANSFGLIVPPLVGIWAKNQRRVGIAFFNSPILLGLGSAAISIIPKAEWPHYLVWITVGSTFLVAAQMVNMTTSMAICAWERKSGTAPPGAIAGAYTMSGSLGILVVTQVARLCL